MRPPARMTQEQFSDISGFSQQYVSGLERGLRNPTIVTLYELAKALGLATWTLFGRRPPGPSASRRLTNLGIPNKQESVGSFCFARSRRHHLRRALGWSE